MSDTRTEVDVLIVGTGFAGLGMAVQLQRAGRPDFVVLERGGDVGGTWRDNTYPGAACDVPSHLYSFSFAPNPTWTRSFSPQPEIQAYLRSVADRFGVRDRIRFHHTVTDARWDDPTGRWEVVAQTPDGPAHFSARVLLSATGALSDPTIPDLPGLASFTGTVFHSARWDHSHDLTGERVAVVGTGASAIQLVPQIQPKVARLALFQRTAPWVIPRHDRPITRVERRLYARIPAVQRLARALIYWGRETYAVAFTRNTKLLALPRKLALSHIAKQIKDPELRAKVTPSYTIGCKRILISNDYYPALAQPNVDVVTDGIAEITPTGVRTHDGAEHAVDTIIFATGFHVTDMPVAQHVHGTDGRTLAQHWEDGMFAHRGTTVPGFPNLFLLVGPNTGLGHTSQVFMIEQQIGYVLRALELMDSHGATTLEVRPDAVARDDAEIQARMATSVWTTGGCASWYLDARGRNTTLWPDFTFRFKSRLSSIDARDHLLSVHAPQPAPELVEAR
ncbi:MAG TPA: NAD(P)/FAD-dependent oxidoreductase [Mycobacteriales bacterium]|nr:NAD(P)/FAD-dependent oxidoreductase [Mycobacteriales bacterium]